MVEEGGGEQTFPTVGFWIIFKYKKLIWGKHCKFSYFQVSAIVCFHALCCSMDPMGALHELQRVLCDGGKIYFIEHVREPKRFTKMWFLQVTV